MLDYWDQPDDYNFNFDFLSFPHTGPPALQVSRKGPRRSGSSDTIRPSRKNMAPPPPPMSRYLVLPLDTADLDPDSSPSASTSIDNGHLDQGPTIETLNEEKYHIKFSQRLHDGLPDLNCVYDYKSIAKETLERNPVFKRIQGQSKRSAYAMAIEDQQEDQQEDQRLGFYRPNEKPLLPRHVMSLPRRHPHIFGNTREPYVALLEWIALESGGDEMKIISVDKLCKVQTSMYQDVAYELEREMRAEYNKARGDVMVTKLVPR